MKIFKKISKFFKEVKEEAKKISWPTRNELKGSAAVVIIVLIFLTIYIFFIDLTLSKFVEIFLG
ncbi:MAG: preprotein translocase subunit SecE [Candidatus Omnitrophica bacterium]|nr:preprotein translocase subunit SecE [Candidatus Omnitrophota bacterium]